MTYAYVMLTLACLEVTTTLTFFMIPCIPWLPEGTFNPVSFAVNGRTYNMVYYLVDGINPEWAAFVKTIHYPMELKTQHYCHSTGKCMQGYRVCIWCPANSVCGDQRTRVWLGP